ncbi:MAG: SWIM zinc finger family protein [Actinomycetota bacterium]|nr:SWIM zinc finger family protein [Actinomycetota bacterium]
MARQFGNTWWGRTWLDALERLASLDPNRLPRGRTYARTGRVLSVEVEPGTARAVVRGRRIEPYRAELRLRTFGDDEWDTLVEVIVARAARAAALLDGELPTDLVDAASAAGVELLPRARELRLTCSCPDVANPCKHAAAVCYLVADELDTDPFVLLRLRGRDRDRVLADVRARRAAASGAAAAGASAGAPPDDVAAEAVRASEVVSRPLGALPEVPHVRSAPSRPAAWPSDPPGDAPFTAAGLESLAADAAARAWAAMADGAPLLPGLSVDEDLARRAADAHGSDDVTVLARRAATTPRALARRSAAWRVAGAAGLVVVDEPPWRPDRPTMAAARDAVLAAGVAASKLTVDRNRLVVTVGGASCQLRLAGDGAWYRFVKRANAWELDAGPASDPDELIDE